jgi:hypothetical protein
MPLSPLPTRIFRGLNLYLHYSRCNFRPVKVNWIAHHSFSHIFQNPMQDCTSLSQAISDLKEMCYRMVTEGYCPRIKATEMKFIIHLYLMQWLQMHTEIPGTVSWQEHMIYSIDMLSSIIMLCVAIL